MGVLKAAAPCILNATAGCNTPSSARQVAAAPINRQGSCLAFPLRDAAAGLNPMAAAAALLLLVPLLCAILILANALLVDAWNWTLVDWR